MSIWKNTEVRRTALWLLLATAVCSVAAALLYPICGLLTLGLGAVCGAIWYGSTRRRYRELERMSRDIDRILHGQEQQVLPQQEEGELANMHIRAEFIRICRAALHRVIIFSI